MWEKNKEYYKAALELCDEFDLKGKNLLYTSSNTYMFSSMNKAGELGIRLSKEDRATFHSAYTNAPFISYGAALKEHVFVPKELLEDAASLADWLQKGFHYVNTLKPK